MTGQTTTKLRLVKCPRCRALLPESANVPVYQCGGCGTVLQAKKRKKDTKDTGSNTHETDTKQKNELNHAFEDKEARSLCQEEMLPSTGELPLDKNSGSDQNEIKDGNGEQSGNINLSGEHSTELTCHGNEELSPAARSETEVDQDKCSLEESNGGNQNENGHCNGKRPGGVNFSDEVASSTELNHHESEESSMVAGAECEVDENGNCMEQNNGGDQNEYGYGNRKQPGGVNFSDEVASSTALNHLESEESLLVAGAQCEVDENGNCMEQNNGGDQNEYGYGNRKQPADEVASSTELNHQESEESSPAAGTHSEVDENGNCMEQNYVGDQSECGYYNGKRPGGFNFSDEIASSTELNHHESEESSPAAGTHSEVDENGKCTEQNDVGDQSEYGYYNGKWRGGVNFSNEIASSSELNHHENKESSPAAGTHSEVDENGNFLEQNNGRNRSEIGDCKVEQCGNIKFSNEVSSSIELNCQEIEESSPVVGTNTELSEENLLAVSPMDSIITAQRLSAESILTENLMSTHSEQLEQPQKRALDGFDRVSSVDTLENIALANASSDFIVTLRDMPSNYAYDGSVSSYDGTDDQVPDQHLHLSERKFKEAESSSAKAMARRDEVMNKFTSSSPKMQQAWNRSSISSEKKHYAMKGSKWRQGELLEPTRHGHPVRSRMKSETDERLSRMPFYSRGSQVGYANGSPSNNQRNEFQCSTSFHLPKKPKNPEEEKMELLKMVYELQDQLNRTHLSKGKANGRFPGVAGKEKQVPSYHDHVAPEVETCHDFSHAQYPRRCNQGKSRPLPHQSQSSRIPFSAEATINRHQVDHSCLQCCPHDWQCSAPLPPHVCCNKSQYAAHPCLRCYNLYSSNSSSPQHYTSSEFSLRSCDAKCDDHWHKNHEPKKYSRERHHLAKRHVRPVADGAPFLVCYHCSKLLQLPADFLLFRRRCHKLRCSACSVELKFSLQNRSHIVPYTVYTPEAIAPPPSEVDDCSVANSGTKLASMSYASNCPHADPVSCSDDYGPSLCKSCSTEGEPSSSVLPFHALKRDSNVRKMSSGSSFEPVEERKKRPTFKESPNKFKNSVETFASAGPSSKMSKAQKLSSEIEELPPRAGSPLHRLMGYSSPSQVIDS